MASFGEALEALEEFRAELVNQQMNAAVAQAQAMAFRATAGAADTIVPIASVEQRAGGFPVVYEAAVRAPVRAGPAYPGRKP